MLRVPQDLLPCARAFAKHAGVHCGRDTLINSANLYPDRECVGLLQQEQTPAVLKSATLDGETAPCLSYRHQLQTVDVQMCKLVEDPEKNGLRDVLGLDRAGPLIDRIVLGLITTETHQGKLALA